MDEQTLITIWLIGVPIMGGIFWTISDHEKMKKQPLSYAITVSIFGWLWPIIIAGTFPLTLIIIVRRILIIHEWWYKND